MNVSILPRSDDSYDLGSSDYRWRKAYFSEYIAVPRLFEISLMNDIAPRATVTIDGGTLVNGGPHLRNGRGYWKVDTFPATMTLDLGHVSYWIDAISFTTWFPLHSQYTPKSYLIERSNDGSTWTVVADVTDNTKPYIFHDCWDARYIRITIREPQNGSSQVRIGNLQLLSFYEEPAGRGPFVLDDSGNAFFKGGNVLTQEIKPLSDNTYDLGSSSLRWKNGYFAGALDLGSLKVGGTEVIDSSRVLKNVTASRSILTDLFDSPFWDNIPDKPFEGLGSEFDVDGSNNLIVSSIDFSKIANRLSSLLTFDSSITPNSDNSYDLGSSSYRFRKAYLGSFVANGADSYIDSYGLCIGNTSRRTSGEGLELYGSTSSAILSVQDGNGRIQLKWNATRGTHEKFLVGGENAAMWEFDPNSPSTDLFRIRYASGSSASAGDSITWSDVLRLGTGGLKVFYSGIYPGSDNALDLGSSSLRWKDGYFAGDVYIAGNKVWHAGNDGSGSGLDADTVDGKHASAFADTSLSNVSDSTILNKIKNVDGSGSGLDADLLDGKQSGNSSGQIPISNGTKCTNLNADMVDGEHASAFTHARNGGKNIWVQSSEPTALETGDIWIETS